MRGLYRLPAAAIPARGHRAKQSPATTMTDSTAVHIARSRRPGRWARYTISDRATVEGKSYYSSIIVDRRDGGLHVEARQVTVSRGGKKVSTTPAFHLAELPDTVRAALLAAMPAAHTALCLAAVAAYVPPGPLPPPALLPADYVAAQDRAIAADHAADVACGMSDDDAADSDAFERRVLGIG